MNCLLVSSTAAEIGLFLEYYRNSQKRWHVDIDIDVLITGIGLTAATYHITRQLYLKRPDMVIQAGIAGSYNEKLFPGSVVTVKQDRVADEGVFENKKWKTLEDLKLRKAAQPFRSGWLVNPNSAMLTRSRLKAVRAISVNQVSTDKKMIVLYRQKFNPGIESMEGAALHYTCISENIPFLQVRAISNFTGERNKKKWSTSLAIENLNRELARLFDSL